MRTSHNFNSRPKVNSDLPDDIYQVQTPQWKIDPTTISIN